MFKIQINIEIYTVDSIFITHQWKNEIFLNFVSMISGTPVNDD
jgi:hypothetical protein